MTDEKAIEKMVYDQQQGWPLCGRRSTGWMGG